MVSRPVVKSFLCISFTLSFRQQLLFGFLQNDDIDLNPQKGNYQTEYTRFFPHPQQISGHSRKNLAF